MEQQHSSIISCCVRGTLKNGWLTANGKTIKVRGNPASGKGIWKFVPLTDSSGVVTGASSIVEVREIEPSICVGEVVQFSKRGTVLIEVSQTCKVTLHTDKVIERGSFIKNQIEFKDGALHIISDDSISVANTKTESNLYWIKGLESRIRQKYPSIKLTEPFSKKGLIEWEGIAGSLKVRIEGQEDSTELRFHEFIQPELLSPSSHPDILRVTPLGAARSIGASCFKVEIGNYEIVLDAGTRPKGNQPLPGFEHLNNPNLILITHAHQDHIGALPVLHSMYPATPMVCTPGTREIARVMLSDCLKVQRNNEDFEALFDETELQQTLLQLETQPVGIQFEPLPGLKVKFINAGHIVGAACIHLQLGNRSLLYTGDYNLSNTRTTEGLKIDDLPKSDILITEATYGATIHSRRNDQESELINSVIEVIKSGGNVLIPAFALGRAQEIILALKTSGAFTNLGVPIYIDGLVRAITDVFSVNLAMLPRSVQNLANSSRIAPFTDDIKVIPITDSKERPLALAKPSVIIASSGMLTGGPSVYYAQVLVERENAAIFFSGYTDEESPGRLLQGMKTGEVVTIDQKDYLVKAKIQKFNLSAHTDRLGIGQVIAKVKPKHLVLVHGSNDALYDLAKNSDLQKHYLIHIPGIGEIVEYGNFPEFITESTQIALSHPKEIELEIHSEHEGAWIRIPQTVVECDPRWQRLGQMSAVRAKWHGNGLMLLPITDKTIALEKAKTALTNCCGKCKFLKAGFCSQAESPMFELSIDPYGLCAEFVPFA